MSSPNAIDMRAHWQRTEGMVIFDELFRGHFPQLLERVNAAALARFHGDTRTPLNTAYTAAELVVSLSQSALQESFSPEATARAQQFTHQGPELAIQEAVKSCVFFPINLLGVANTRRSATTPNLIPNLGAIATIFQQPYFGKVCETAAFTANGVWGGFSTLRGPMGSRLPFDIDPPFTYSNTTAGVEFDFSNASKTYLQNALRQRNRSYYEQQSNSEIISDNDKTGTTSGCPVARTAPQFTNDPQDVERLESLASFYDKSPEDVTSPRSESTIVLGVRSFGKLLERINDEL